MKKDEIIKNTKILLKNILVIKERAKNEECTKSESLITNSLLEALNTLNVEEQKIIAYKYFEERTQQEISEILHMGKNTVSRRLERLHLKIGRLVYGFEEEFWCDMGLQ